MKRLILSTASVLLLSTAIAPVAHAQTNPSDAPPPNMETLGMAVTPFRLVFLAYQGFFESEGIPKFNELISAYQGRRVTSEDLVRVAITMRRLSPDTLNNQAYLNSVQQELMSLYGSQDN